MPSGFDQVVRGGELVLFVRLLLAAVVGAAIGWNRFRVGKSAGVGTHALVAVGAALFVAVPAQSGNEDALSRAVQGIATGVGFLGAGEIFRDPKDGKFVQGLTTAAALWATAALGIVAMCASWLVVAAAAAVVLGILELAPKLEGKNEPKIEQGGAVIGEK